MNNIANNYEDFLKKLVEATKQGDDDSKRAILRLAPQKAKKRSNGKFPPRGLAKGSCIAIGTLDSLIEGILGPKPTETNQTIQYEKLMKHVQI